MEHNHKLGKIGKKCKVCGEDIVAVEYGWGYACGCPGTRPLEMYEEEKND